MRDEPIYTTTPPTPRQENTISRVLEEVQSEQDRQEDKWGEQNHANGTGPDHFFLGKGLSAPATNAYLRERATEITDDHAKNGRLTYADILLEEVFEAVAEKDPEKLREELIQVAAVSVSWIEKIDRDKARPPRSSEYRPGDLVEVHVSADLLKEYNGRHAVIIYGPDDQGGYQIASAVGQMRVLPEEITMVTRQEDR